MAIAPGIRPCQNTANNKKEQQPMSDLLSGQKASEYDASSIQVLEDMEHVRLRPGMYIGGKDDRALHHMVAEIIDNSMDEAVAGHATWIELELHENGHVTVKPRGGCMALAHPWSMLCQITCGSRWRATASFMRWSFRADCRRDHWKKSVPPRTGAARL